MALRRLVFVVLAAGVCAAWPLAAQSDRDTRWRADLNVVATELPRRHPNFFANVSRADFDTAVAALSRDIPTLNDAAVVTGMARLAAMARDGHTSLDLTQRAAGLRLLPLQMYWFEEGLYVTAAAQEYSRAIGTRVVQIGGRDIAEVQRAIATVISYENDWWLRHRSTSFLRLSDALQALGITASGDTARLLLEDSRGTRFELDVVAVSTLPALVAAPDSGTGFVPLYRQQPSRNYWFTYIASSGTLYFRYNLCREMSDLSFSAFAAQMLAAFDSNPVQRLVFDLRDNPGGSSAVINPLVNGLQARAARFASTRAFVIFNRGTYSSALLNSQEFKIAQMQQGLTFLRLVGEPTGGKPTSYGEVLSLQLPNSGLTVSYSTRLFTSVFNTDALMPDEIVPLYASDYFARHDPFLAAALAGGPPATATAGQGTLTTVNAASFRLGPVAPGSLASAFGVFGSVNADATSVPLPARLDGIEVWVENTPAPLHAVRPGQINFQVPRGWPSGIARVRVTRGGTEVAAGEIAVTAAAPALFSINTADLSRPGAVLNENSSVNSATNSAVRGTVLQIFGTGQGATDPDRELAVANSVLQPEVYIGSERAEVLFSGTTGQFQGLWQINARVPASGVARQMPLFVTLGGRASNAVTVQIEP